MQTTTKCPPGSDNNAAFNPSVAEWAVIDTKTSDYSILERHKDVAQKMLKLQRLFLQKVKLDILQEKVAFMIDNRMVNAGDGEVARLFLHNFTDSSGIKHTESDSANLFMCFAPSVYEIRLRDDHGKLLGELAPEAVVSLLWLRMRHGMSMRAGLIAHKEFKQSCARCKATWIGGRPQTT
jgi:hypothetical protein